MRIGSYVEHCISNGDSQSAAPHQRQIGKIIPDRCNAIIGKVAGKLYLIINCKFIAYTLPSVKTPSQSINNRRIAAARF
jgi:hypothetical protein